MVFEKQVGHAATTMKPNEQADTVKYATFLAFTRRFRQNHMRRAHRQQGLANSGTFASNTI
ncbi:MAG: hypothetical protein C0487_08040 [Leptothrix sp. (in: Bacteria)]|nr:hypothetical protein [Leptothrix sp. (in: b-proteobacteria)]